MNNGFRADIEGLRGVAVLLVVADHLTGWPRGGFLGVDVFFVLSGFLITGLLLTESQRSGRVDLRAFYARRARRLLPAAALVLVVIDLASAALLLPARAHATVVDSLWALGSAANLWFAHLGTDYFSRTRPPSPVQHYWSLSVEEQFYVVWPTALLLTAALARRRGWSVRGALVVVASAVVAGSFAWSVLTAGSSYFSSPARAWELGAGALLALTPPVVRRGRTAAALAALGAAGLLLSVVVITPATPVPGYAAALPVLSVLTLLHSGPGALGWAPLRFFGRISYSLYLWHWPVLVLARDLPGGDAPWVTAAAALLALGLSVASWRWVETPVRRSSWLSRGSRPARGPLAAPAWVVSVALVLAGVFALTASSGTAGKARAQLDRPLPELVAQGLALRAWPSGLADVAHAGSPEWLQDGCLDVGPRNEQRCTYGRGPVDVALVGDSIAIGWLPGLRIAGVRRGWRIHVLTKRQCPVAQIPAGETRAVSASCAEHQRWVAQRVRSLDPALVISSSRYGGATPEQWRTGLVAGLRLLGPARTVLLQPAPDTGNLQQCHTRISSPSACVAAVTTQFAQFSAADRAAAAEVGARFVDTTAWFCLDQRCPAVVAGLAVHTDGEHLTAAFSRVLAPELARDLVT